MKKIIVVKIGSSTLLTKRNKLDLFRIAHIAGDVAVLRTKGYSVVLVVSGAVACGSRVVPLTSALSKRASAGIGQIKLTGAFANSFEDKGMQIAQILLTKQDFIQKKSAVRKLLMYYIDSNIIPLLNENDVISLNSFAGNDYLAAEISKLLQSGQLVMLSRMQKSVFGVGGGEAKERVRRILKKHAIETYIVNGKAKHAIQGALL